MSAATNGNAEPPSPAAKKQPQDFKFGKVIGDGSFSTVYLAQEISTKKEFAIKVIEKQHLRREKKVEYAKRERDVLAMINHPFFIRLYFTFQDPEKLYFCLTYAKRGDLLEYINRLGSFDENCTQFYTAEIVLALEYIHSKGIIHRDLKPENILLNEQMHIQITDFGSARIMQIDNDEATQKKEKRLSFVGTAQYVSPEVLTSKKVTYSCDLWALGCIIYQFISGQLPFWAGNEYQIFQKITKLEYEFPEGFDTQGNDLVTQLLKIDPDERLGAKEKGGYEPLKQHTFFDGIEWHDLPNQTPPSLVPYLPATCSSEESLWSSLEPGLPNRLLDVFPQSTEAPSQEEDQALPKTWLERTLPKSDEERTQRLHRQSMDNEYHRFVNNNLILYQGTLDKRKGLFARRRMFLLTEGPRLYYVDPATLTLKGEIPWSKELKTEVKKFKVFFVHTPNRTYYLEDPQAKSVHWCKRIDEVYEHYYGKQQ